MSDPFKRPYNVTSALKISIICRLLQSFPITDSPLITFLWLSPAQIKQKNCFV